MWKHVNMSDIEPLVSFLEVLSSIMIDVHLGVEIDPVHASRKVTSAERLSGMTGSCSKL